MMTLDCEIQGVIPDAFRLYAVECYYQSFVISTITSMIARVLVLV